jgi:hypothetical protein
VGAVLGGAPVGTVRADYSPDGDAWTFSQFKRPFEEGLHALVDFLAQFRDLALRDAGKAHRLRDLFDPTRRQPADPGDLDDGDQRLFRRFARLQKRRELAAGRSSEILRLSEQSRVSIVRSRKPLRQFSRSARSCRPAPISPSTSASISNGRTLSATTPRK